MNALIFQSDFGVCDGAVAAMHGVAYSQDSNLKIYNLTHDIPQYDIWEASYRLIQSISFWPSGSVFVSVVDPGVGSSRRSVVVKTTTGQLIVTPDNGTLTHVKKMLGIEEVRLLEETKNHLPIQELSYTFHGRDVYAYTGARLASGKIKFEEIGPKIGVSSIIELKTVSPIIEENKVTGTIDVLDVRYGSLWSNIPYEDFKKLNISVGDKVEVTITHSDRVLYQNFIYFKTSFSDVRIGEPLIYINSLNNIGLAINQGSFAKAYNIKTGINWKISFKK
ncbi:SAM hydrolase/SAM-dependent halogenase family protein [Caviibacter abscessus]|uniref:SAM hydrolase/SAM-dependent halogenase family protein n=1 Tax=Caviibacter abscessus TaxID=1766719 RepID=UPI000A70D287|nr:S-adenosyl-l-methionine hydroxide adenosyltransferase family protein [Caviibacter abscessus]